MDLNEIGSICSIISLIVAVVIYILQRKISKDLTVLHQQISNSAVNNPVNSTQRGIIGNSNTGDISGNVL
jgi:hypothetical protein